MATGTARRRRARTFAALLLYAPWSAAQQTPSSIPTTRTSLPAITVQNLAASARKEGCVATVPFSQGQVRGTPPFVVPGTPTAWQPLGATWPDGSLRHALCLFPIEMAATSEKRLELVPGEPLVDPGPEIALPQCELALVVTKADKAERAVLAPGKELERNALRRIVRFAARVGTSGVVAEAFVTAWRDQELAHVDLGVFFSDPASKATQCDVQLVTLECKGRAALLRNAGPLAMLTEFTETGSTTVLLKDTHLGDGQGIRRAGVLASGLRGDKSLADSTTTAAAQCPLLAACDWRKSGAWGPFGHVPEPPPAINDANARALLNTRRAAFLAKQRETGEPFATPALGLARQAGQTGDQEDFGVAKLGAVAGTGLGSFLPEVELSVLQEACRPVHAFENDGTMVLAANHPKWVVWIGRTHWHCRVSVDRLGKDCPEPGFDTHGWIGKDRQHWSSLNLDGFYLLTGSPSARAEIENEIQLILSGETIDPGYSTSGSDAPRAMGRTMLTAAWHYLCTGDKALEKRIHERCERIYIPGWEGRALPEDKVRPMVIGEPDPRQLDGKTRFWNPWGESLAAVGLEAVWRVVGDTNARDLGRALARNVVRHGWKMDARETIIATSMRWKGGEPLTTEELALPGIAYVMWSYQTAFSVWSLGAVEIAKRSAQELGDEALAARATEIQRRVRAGRETPKPLWWDRFGEWDGVW